MNERGFVSIIQQLKELRIDGIAASTTKQVRRIFPVPGADHLSIELV
jgi:hypothetical protein